MGKSKFKTNLCKESCLDLLHVFYHREGRKVLLEYHSSYCFYSDALQITEHQSEIQQNFRQDMVFHCRANERLLDAVSSDEVDTASLIENGQYNASTKEVVVCPSFLSSQPDCRLC